MPKCACQKTMTALDYLKRAVKDGASDLFLLAGSPVIEKVRGKIQNVNDTPLFVAEIDSLVEEIYSLAKKPVAEDSVLRSSDDFSFAVPDVARFRVNAYRQRGSTAMVVRIVPFEIPSWETLNISEEVIKLANAADGLILVTGGAGSGKSATQACMIDHINQTRRAHIITLEDPIEYLHRHSQSIISQREVAVDADTILDALKDSLHQAPDVILLGEMREAEIISTAITAAETGRLVIATMHTKGAVNTIERILDTFPEEQQKQIRTQLSSSLRAIVSQQLLPKGDGTRIPAFEIMHMNNAIRKMILNGECSQINNEIASGGVPGMISMDQYILNLYQDGHIDRATALLSSNDPKQLARKI